VLEYIQKADDGSSANRKGASIVSDTWFHVTVTWDGTLNGAGINFYVDGSLANTSAGTSSGDTIVDDSGGDLWIGSRNTGDRTFMGIMDEVRMSSVERSADWIEASYLSQNGAFAFTNFGGNEVATTDKAAPVLLSNDTADLDGDGFIDALHLTFSEAVSDASIEVSDFTVSAPGVTGLAFSATAGGDTADDADIYLTFDDDVHDTGITPSLAYAASGGTDVEDLAANLLADFGATAATDTVGPVIVGAVASPVGVIVTTLAPVVSLLPSLKVRCSASMKPSLSRSAVSLLTITGPTASVAAVAPKSASRFAVRSSTSVPPRAA
jgi:hypothetical protein